MLQLETIHHQRETQSTLSKFLGAVIPGSGGLKLSEKDVVSQYLHHADTVEAQTDALITEGEALLVQLYSLDGMLDTLRETANRDLVELKLTKEELFSNLWTYLGAQSSDKKRLDKNIAVVQKLKETRAAAADVVRVTVSELRKIKDKVIDISARVNLPRYRGEMAIHEIEEHIQYVEDGLDRLNTRRVAGRDREQRGIRARIDYANQIFKGFDGLNGRFALPELER